MMKKFLEIVLFFVYFRMYIFHPQCLDYRAPFKPRKSLSFCSNYSSYSCCTVTKDNYIKSDYRYALDHQSQNLIESCGGFVKQLVCLECHPYAAHVFDAEGVDKNERFNKRLVNFPGLCKSYCKKIFESCKSLILRVLQDHDFYRFVNDATTEDFCSWAEIPDSNYCYPNVDEVDKRNSVLRVDSNNSINLCVKPLGVYFANPLVAVHANDGSRRLFVGQQNGVIYIINGEGEKLDKPFLDISDKIINSGSAWDERGLLGLVFHPKYRENGRFYVYYSAPIGERSNYTHYEWYWQKRHRIRISEFTVDPANPNQADNNYELSLLEVNQPEPNHNGGMILFGEDGYLYVFIGDGGGSGDNHGDIGNGLDMSTLLGKVLRIDVDSETKLYSIPPDNPFLKVRKSKPEIYAFGIRNMWRCSVDRGEENGRGKGRIFCGDVGQNRFEEIDIIEKGGNYGWKAFEGNYCFDENLCNKSEYVKNLTFPILTYPHNIGRSIVGGYVYRGCESPNLSGKYIYGDTMTGRIFVAEQTNDTWTAKEVVMGNKSICNEGLSDHYFKHILSFGENELGELLILSSYITNPGTVNGMIYRLVDPQLRGDPETCRFSTRKPQPLKSIRRREIYNMINDRNKPTTTKPPTESSCQDSKSLCSRYFKPYKGKKALLKCSNLYAYTRKYCRKTCNHCE